MLSYPSFHGSWAVFLDFPCVRGGWVVRRHEDLSFNSEVVCSFGGGQTLVSVLCVVLEEGLKTVCTNCKGLSRCGVWGSLSHL